MATLGEYLSAQRKASSKSGELYCANSEGGERRTYHSCESFAQLRNSGCYGYSTYEIGQESRFAATCAKIEALSDAEHSSKHYFQLDAFDWWKTLPAEIIPITGGIYSDETVAVAKQRRNEMVEGKSLGEIAVSEVTNSPGYLSATLEQRHDECGRIKNKFEIKAAMLADVDGDGIAELFIEGFRVNQSDTCLLGSGNTLGAEFGVVLYKSRLDSPIIISRFPNSD